TIAGWVGTVDSPVAGPRGSGHDRVVVTLVRRILDMALLRYRGVTRMNRSLRGPGAVAVFGLAAAGWTARHDPKRRPGFFPPCLFREVTGLACPACGGTRMAHHLLRRRWRAALRANPVLLVIGLPLLGWLWLRWTSAAARGEPPRPLPRAAVGAVVTIAVTWAVIRNVPARVQSPTT